MKIISIKYMMLFAFAMVFAACSSDGEVRHLGVTAVKALYEPDNGKAVVLQASASASLYFEWGAVVSRRWWCCVVRSCFR